MHLRCQKVLRYIAPLLTAGVLLQGGGCMFDASSVTAGVLTSIASTILSGLVFSAFNLVP